MLHSFRENYLCAESFANITFGLCIVIGRLNGINFHFTGQTNVLLIYHLFLLLTYGFIVIFYILLMDLLSLSIYIHRQFKQLAVSLEVLEIRMRFEKNFFEEFKLFKIFRLFEFRLFRKFFRIYLH